MEISANRHSGGSDKYSVVDKNDEEEEADTSYAIIDMTDPVPRCLNQSELRTWSRDISGHLSLVRCLNLARGPDIIRDLPAPAPAPGSARAPRRVGRSSSFLAPGSSAEAGAGGVARQGGPRRSQGARLQRSVSSVSSCAGPGARAVVPRCGVRALTSSSHTAASSVHRSASIVSDAGRSYPR